MSHYSLLIGFDTKQLGLKSQNSHYSVKALIVVDEGTFYESQTALLPYSAQQGVVEVNFQLFKQKVVLLLQVCIMQAFDTQLYQKEVKYYHADHAFELISDPQNIIFQNKKEEIYAQCALTRLEFDAMTCLPLVEADLSDFRMPKSGLMFSAHFAVEIQTDTFKVTKFMGCSQCDLSSIVLPFQPEFLLKIVYMVQLFGIAHSFCIANAKVQNSQALIKGALFEVTEVDCQLAPAVFALIDTLAEMIGNAVDETRDEQGNKIKLSGVMNPQFLQRFVLFKNPKLVAVNMPRFQAMPPVLEVSDKKLQKIVDAEIMMCEDIARQSIAQYASYQVKGSVFVVIQTFPAAMKTQEQAFKDLQRTQKSLALAAVKIDRKAADFGFVLLSNKEVDLDKAIQQFEVGTGNLAYCKLTDTKQFLQLMHRANYSQVVKLLANNAKSLVLAAKTGLSLHTVAYEESIPFSVRCTRFSQDQIESGIQNKQAYLEEKISANARLRVYIQDLIYCEKNELQAAEAPEESILNESVNNLSAEELTACRASINSRVSFVSRAYNQRAYDPAKYVDYFGQKVKTTQMCSITKYVKTFRQFRAEAAEYARMLAERAAYEAEQRRIEQEKAQQLEEEQRRREQEEQERLERERLEEERKKQEQEEMERLEQERIAEQQRLEELERQRQIEQLKLMQMHKRYVGANGKKTARKLQADQRTRPQRTIQVDIDNDLIALQLTHTRKHKTRSDKILQVIKANKARLRQLELQFQKQTMDMQYQLQQAYSQHNSLARNLEQPPESEESDFQEEMALELLRQKERLETQQNEKLKLMELEYEQAVQRDQNQMLTYKQHMEQQQQRREEQKKELMERARRRQEIEQNKYDHFIRSRKMYRLGQVQGSDGQTQ